ncbi:MAG: hypothetical protein KGI06_01760 [Candidatus Micrarchaeota archaeon]|nr:hypothetical protein [Candidatus Micrarchaeota archaeon]
MGISRAQASIDMLVAYGIAILMITISLYVLLQLGIFNSRAAPTYCAPSPSFSCDGVAIHPNGTMIMVFSQSTGGSMIISGVACSTQQNVSSDSPKYGNVHVLPYGAAPGYYPDNQLQGGITAYSSNETKIRVNCYSGPKVAKARLGNEFSGYVWINYTISELPGSYSNVQRLASVSVKYT